MRLLLLFLFISSSCFADNFTYVVGGITPHIQKPSTLAATPLCNEISKGSGIIFNRLKSYRYSYSKWTTGFLVGENSYCKPIWGATQSYSFIRSPRFEVSSTVGFYRFQKKYFDFSKGSFFANIGNFYFVPVVGIEVNYTLYSSKKFKVKLMNLITPVITHHSIGFMFNI